MQTKTMTAVLGLTILLCSSRAWAHDESMHKQKPTHGRIATLKGETLTVTTDDGPVSVVLTAETKVERADKVVGRDALTAGTPVDVYGTTVPGQGIVAREVVVDATHGEHSEAGQAHAH